MNGPTTDQDKLFFLWISRYLLVLSGTCKLPCGKEGKFNYSACLASYKGKDFVLTVGHAFTDLEDEVFRFGGTITGAALADYFGLVPKSKEPFPFNMFDYQHTFVNDKSAALDYALIELSDLHSRFLRANGVESFQLGAASRLHDSEPSSHVVIGFPEERVKCVMHPANPLVEMEIEPNGLKLQRLQDDAPRTKQRFVGKIINLGDLKSTKGFSGGPILGFVERPDEPVDCHLLAIQESWNEVDTIYGCLFDRIFEHAQPWLDARVGMQSQPNCSE